MRPVERINTSLASLLAVFNERAAALYADGKLSPTPATTCSA
jgi:hypothetical protein